MTAARCATRVPFERLAGWWLREPGPAPGADDALEEHLFGCEACTARLEQFAALADGVRRHARAGALRGAVTPAVLERLAAEGVGVKRYALEPGGSVACSAGPRDDAMVVSLRLPASAVAALDAASAAAATTPPWRLDAVFSSGGLGPSGRVEDVPVASDGAVHWVEPGAYVRTLPDHVLEIRLVAAGPAGDSEIARYTLHHSARGE